MGEVPDVDYSRCRPDEASALLPLPRCSVGVFLDPESSQLLEVLADEASDQVGLVHPLRDQFGC